MSDPEKLAARRCKPCEGGVPVLGQAAVAELRRVLHPDWTLSVDGKWLVRSVAFENYARTLGFVNAVGWIAESEAHHPDLEVVWGKCVVKWSTHAVDGLTENDFICAAKVDQLLI